MSLQVSVVGAPGVQVFGAPFVHWFTVTWQAPSPQVCVPGFTFVQDPAVVPEQVARLGSWQVG
jgi:hypothetical protein